MRSILVAEDDLHLSNIIEDSMSREYSVKCVTSLAQAFEVCEGSIFDLVIVDRMLPDGDALSLIEYLHQTSFQTKILAISRMYQPSEKIRGLEHGADDYLPKPFVLGELKLKVKKMLSYDKRIDVSVYALKELRFFPDSGELQLPDSVVSIRKKESRILECLFKYINRTVSRDTLIQEVWPQADIVPTQTTLDVYIRRIRLLLGSYGHCIVTKRGFGYMLMKP